MIGRRRFFHCSLCASGAWLLGCGPSSEERGDAGLPDCPSPFAGGERLGMVPFVGEDLPLDRRLGAGWDGRLYADLSVVTATEQVLDNDRFYLRTFYPDLLDPAAPWSITVDGLVGAPATWTLDDLRGLVRPQGVHVLECSGNGPRGGFGLLSAADWSGALLADVLAGLAVDPSATAVLVSGFDMHSVPSEGGHSTPGASWIFTLDQIAEAGAFLATQMNGMPLPPDHGAPVRLYVPGWYGCTCIKWVNAIRLVGPDEPATPQMIEFASRTHQDGTPALARDYRPASLEQAAMPVRVERWRTRGGELLYRVMGILWGGRVATDALVFEPSEGAPAPVEVCPRMTQNQTWTTWQHAWRVESTGEHTLRMRIDDPSIPTRRLDAGYYARRVQIDAI